MKTAVKRRPSGREMQKRLAAAGVHAWRVTRHRDDTYTAGLLIRTPYRYGSAAELEAANKVAQDAADKIVRGLRYQIIAVGTDLSPGYQTLGFSGTTTPMVHFSIEEGNE